ncbi:MAG: sulfatase-like hydrolase/transferase [Acidimicrobiales bacterium]
MSRRHGRLVDSKSSAYGLKASGSPVAPAACSCHAISIAAVCHAEVDEPLDRVRRAVTDHGSDAIILKTSDHGDLLGAHGGLHQKWFNLYDEATRVPFSIARVGERGDDRNVVDGASHLACRHRAHAAGRRRHRRVVGSGRAAP